MGKILKFIIGIILIGMIVSIVYAYTHIDNVIEYRENKNVNQNLIVNNSLKFNIIENKVKKDENIVKNKENKNKNKEKSEDSKENIVQNIVENVVENVVENNIKK